MVGFWIYFEDRAKRIVDGLNATHEIKKGLKDGMEIWGLSKTWNCPELSRGRLSGAGPNGQDRLGWRHLRWPRTPGYTNLRLRQRPRLEV